jgi:DNA-directed RNA polymerase specialized sigma24 family protein
MVDYMNPIDDPEFNLFTWRDPNPEMMSVLRSDAGVWRASQQATNNARAKLHDSVLKAKLTGHSYGQIREATGLGTGTIQMILAKAGIKQEDNK